MGGLISTLPAAFGKEVKPAAGKSCIFVYLLGGPPHLDTFDLKPDAPAEIRGPFQPIATSVPGVSICEHLLQDNLDDRGNGSPSTGKIKNSP